MDEPRTGGRLTPRQIEALRAVAAGEALPDERVSIPNAIADALADLQGQDNDITALRELLGGVDTAELGRVTLVRTAELDGLYAALYRARQVKAEPVPFRAADMPEHVGRTRAAREILGDL